MNKRLGIGVTVGQCCIRQRIVGEGQLGDLPLKVGERLSVKDVRKFDESIFAELLTVIRCYRIGLVQQRKGGLIDSG